MISTRLWLAKCLTLGSKLSLDKREVKHQGEQMNLQKFRIFQKCDKKWEFKSEIRAVSSHLAVRTYHSQSQYLEFPPKLSELRAELIRK